MLPKLPKHVGKDRLYETWRIHVYRKQIPQGVMTETGIRVVRRFPREYMGRIGPVYVKDARQLDEYCRQIAYAQRNAGPYDWTFGRERLDNATVRTKEDLDRPVNLSGDPEKDSRQVD